MVLGTAVAPAAANVPPERAALQANEPPGRAALQARVQAVRVALRVGADGSAEASAGTPAARWLLAQATNWTNWPKWSKWSNWANK